MGIFNRLPALFSLLRRPVRSWFDKLTTSGDAFVVRQAHHERRRARGSTSSPRAETRSWFDELTTSGDALVVRRAHHERRRVGEKKDPLALSPELDEGSKGERVEAPSAFAPQR
jgi:hypothetical protein